MCSTFYQAYISVYFIAYQDYIVKELCVQKDNQQGCNGKCYLMKKLTNKVSDNNITTPLQNEKEFRGNFIYFFSKNLPFKLNYLYVLKLEKIEYYIQLKSSFYLEKETPPPKFYI